MPSNALSFAITARDEATPALKRIEAELASLFQKVATAQTSELGAIQKEISGLLKTRDQIAKPAPGMASGQEKTLSFLKGVGGFAEKALGHVTKLGAALGVLGGAGLTAGLIENQRRYANLAHAIGIQSHLSGVSPQRLQSLQNSASILGVDPSAIGDSLQNINDVASSIRQFLPGSAEPLRDLVAMQQTGNLPKGTIDPKTGILNASTDQLFGYLRTAISKQLNHTDAHGNNDQMATAQKIAGDFGIDIGSIAPVLLASQKEWQATQDRASSAAKPISNAGLHSGDALFQATQTRLLTQLNLGNDVAGRLADSATKAEQTVGEMIKSLDGPAVAAAGHLADAINKASLHPLLAESALLASSWAANGAFTIATLSGLNKVRKAMGLTAVVGGAGEGVAAAGAGGVAAEGAAGLGLLGALGLPLVAAGAGAGIIYEIAKNSPPITTGINPNLANRGHAGVGSYPRHPASKQQWAKDLTQLEGYGWGQDQAAGILGDWMQESSGDQAAVNGNAYGLAQWMPKRQRDFEALFHHPMSASTRSEQIQFANWEFNHTEKATGDRLRQTRGAAASALVYSGAERAGDNSDPKRAAYADQMMQLGPAVSVAPIAAQAAGMSGPTGDATVRIKVDGPAKVTDVSHGTNYKVAAVPTSNAFPFPSAVDAY